MIIISELTGKEYSTVDECLKAEEEFSKKKAEEEKAKIAHEEALNEAYEEAVTACERYLKLAGNEVEYTDGIKTYTFNSKDDELFDKFYRVLY